MPKKNRRFCLLSLVLAAFLGRGGGPRKVARPNFEGWPSTHSWRWVWICVILTNLVQISHFRQGLLNTSKIGSSSTSVSDSKRFSNLKSRFSWLLSAFKAFFYFVCWSSGEGLYRKLVCTFLSDSSSVNFRSVCVIFGIVSWNASTAHCSEMLVAVTNGSWLQIGHGHCWCFIRKYLTQPAQKLWPHSAETAPLSSPWQMLHESVSLRLMLLEWVTENGWEDSVVCHFK
ncbi:Hypothetical_protein [Hexamita inflata]|uniref:Hypothetical_protein n=1 Tax=Hexamita inflata TaxID=28002 RepID=A0AA86UVZ8_9EUKA|nr:Hypothetical protein HINF_LOCUS54587 [Hexamita inflata]